MAVPADVVKGVNGILDSDIPINQKLHKVIRKLKANNLVQKQTLLPSQILCHPQNRGFMSTVFFPKAILAIVLAKATQAMHLQAFVAVFPCHSAWALVHLQGAGGAPARLPGSATNFLHSLCPERPCSYILSCPKASWPFTSLILFSCMLL